MKTQTYSDIISSSRTTKTYPKKNQAILYNALPNTKIADYIFTTGNIVGAESIIAASRISNNRICIYLDSKEKVDGFISSSGGITINQIFIPACKLVAPTKKIIFSNVQPCIPDSLLLDQIQALNLKPASTIQDLHLKLENGGKYTHVRSFRRCVYVYSEIELQLPDSFLISFEDENYRIYLSNDQLRCYLCKSFGHVAEKCDNKLVESFHATASNESQETNDSSNNEINLPSITTNHDGKGTNIEDKNNSPKIPAHQPPQQLISEMETQNITAKRSLPSSILSDAPEQNLKRISSKKAKTTESSQIAEQLTDNKNEKSIHKTLRPLEKHITEKFTQN
jgi:hypothetical protein